MKKCRLCKKEKSLDEFYKRKSSKDGYRNECKECLKQKEKDRRNRNKEENKKKHYKYRKNNLSEVKACMQCGKEKELKHFHKNPEHKDGSQSYCKDCTNKNNDQYRKENYKEMRKYLRNYYRENKEFLVKRAKEYRENNLDELKECIKCNKTKSLREFNYNLREVDGTRNTCKKCHSKQTLKYYHTTTKYKPEQIIRRRIGSYIHQRLKSNKKGISWRLKVDYSLDELIDHLEKQFTEEMTWNNYGTYWHLDHIVPVSFFEYDSYDHVEFKMCWSLENLQPLEAKKNMSKSNQLDFSDKQLRALDKICELV